MLVTLPIFAKFHPQTTETQPFEFECFSKKTLRFQQHDLIIYDVSVDFGIFFGMWNSLVMSYFCAKFHHDPTIDNGINCIFHVICVFLDKWQRFQYNNVTIYDIINVMQIFFNIWAYTFDGLSFYKVSL